MTARRARRSFCARQAIRVYQGCAEDARYAVQFERRGQSGGYVSELLPHFSTVVDDVTIVRSMHTDQFNHAPAQLLLHTGNPRLGRRRMGPGSTYGLGTENQNLPGFIVLFSGGKIPMAARALWGTGFLPAVYQGVQCRSQGEPVLYCQQSRRAWTRRCAADARCARDLNDLAADESGDPEP